MEKKLFTWIDYDPINTLLISFYDCTLLQNIGSFTKGDRIANIVIDFDNGIMEIYLNAEDIYPITYKLELSIREAE